MWLVSQQQIHCLFFFFKSFGSYWMAQVLSIYNFLWKCITSSHHYSVHHSKYPAEALQFQGFFKETAPSLAQPSFLSPSSQKTAPLHPSSFAVSLLIREHETVHYETLSSLNLLRPWITPSLFAAWGCCTRCFLCQKASSPALTWYSRHTNFNMCHSPRPAPGILYPRVLSSLLHFSLPAIYLPTELSSMGSGMLSVLTTEPKTIPAETLSKNQLLHLKSKEVGLGDLEASS